MKERHLDTRLYRRLVVVCAGSGVLPAEYNAQVLRAECDVRRTKWRH